MGAIQKHRWPFFETTLNAFGWCDHTLRQHPGCYLPCGANPGPCSWLWVSLTCTGSLPTCTGSLPTQGLAKPRICPAHTSSWACISPCKPACQLPNQRPGMFGSHFIHSHVPLQKVLLSGSNKCRQRSHLFFNTPNNQAPASAGPMHRRIAHLDLNRDALRLVSRQRWVHLVRLGANPLISTSTVSEQTCSASRVPCMAF